MADSPLRVGVQVDFALAEALLQQLEARGGDLRPVLAGAIDPDVTEQIEQQFETRGAHWQTPWRPLSLTTIRLRTRVVGNAKKPSRRRGTLTGRRTVARTGRARAGFSTPMRDTLRLWAAYVKAGGPGSLRIIDRLRYERGVQGSVVPYAAGQAEGFEGTIFGKHPMRVPARPVFPPESKGFPAPVLAAWEGMITRYIETGRVS